MTIGNIIKNVSWCSIITSLLWVEVRRNNFEYTNDPLVVRGRFKEKWKKREKDRSKSHGRTNTFGKSKEKCWKYNKVGNFIRHCKEEKMKNKKENNDFDDFSKRPFQEDGRDAFIVDLEANVDQIT
jgi:hypothetical protein